MPIYLIISPRKMRHERMNFLFCDVKFPEHTRRISPSLLSLETSNTRHFETMCRSYDLSYRYKCYYIEENYHRLPWNRWILRCDYFIKDLIEATLIKILKAFEKVCQESKICNICIKYNRMYIKLILVLCSFYYK